MRIFGWFRKKPNPPMEPPVIWKQVECEWLWLVTITERNNLGGIVKFGVYPCTSAEVAADIQAKFCCDRNKNYSNAVVRQAIFKSADEAAPWPI